MPRITALLTAAAAGALLLGASGTATAAAVPTNGPLPAHRVIPCKGNPLLKIACVEWQQAAPASANRLGR
jgi:Spy/CpxP family protein refolding chaperone